jgi:hypothetical protein
MSARAAIVAVAIALTWWTWARWRDVQIDCGRELYIPIQIIHGKMLYRDIWYTYGPLEPYLAAFLVVLFGQYLNVFYLFGLAMAIASALLFFEIGLILRERAVGLATAFAVLFQGFGIGNFNYIFPYSYAACLALLLSLLCAYLTLRNILNQNRLCLRAAGLAAGLALLCKPEFGVVCYLLLAFEVLMDAAHQRSPRTLLSGIKACVPGLSINIAGSCGSSRPALCSRAGWAQVHRMFELAGLTCTQPLACALHRPS